MTDQEFEKLVKDSGFYESKYNCCQTPLFYYQEKIGFDLDKVMKMASGMGNGMNAGSTCGACVAGSLIVGYFNGPENGLDPERRAVAYKKVREFVEEFKAANGGTCLCGEMLGCDPGTPEGQKHIAENKLYYKVCPKAVRTTMDILEKYTK